MSPLISELQSFNYERTLTSLRGTAKACRISLSSVARILKGGIQRSLSSEGVILCESYDHLTGNFFTTFIEKHFNSLFDKANKNGSRLRLQDGDPSQNSRAAKRAMKICNCERSLIQIPPRSSDLNLNIFSI